MTNNNIKVSVIIPVYNTEEYVRQAVNSIREQTLCELEIIIVNDGSTDGSLQILEELAAEDERIHLFSQENQGQSMARNYGLAQAVGQYVYFMDSDDILEKDALEQCYETCGMENLDFVFFDAEVLNECDNSSFQMDYHHHNIENRIYNGLDMLNYLIDTHQLKIPPYLSFIRKTYIDSIALRFHPGIIHEDQLFTVLLYANAQKVAYIHRAFFLRRIRNASTMTQRIKWRNVIGYFTAFEKLQEFASYKNTKTKHVIEKHLRITLNAFIYNAHVMTAKEKMRLLKLCVDKGYVKHLKIKNLMKFILS